MAEQMIPAPTELALPQPAGGLPLRRLSPLDVASGAEADLRERQIPFVEDRDAFAAFAAELQAEAARDPRTIPLSQSRAGTNQ